MSAADAKPLILVSETLLLEGVVPRDLLEAIRFDLRSVQNPAEMAILAKAIPPRVIILDLRSLAIPDMELERILTPLQAVATERRLPHFPVLGIADEGQGLERALCYEKGVSSLLLLPQSPAAVHAELEALLGLKVRRLERKEINLGLKLSTADKTWSVTARSINTECVAVVTTSGGTLPPLGQNVQIEPQVSDTTALDLRLWAFCWREANGNQMLLRFLEPSAAMLKAIESLPEQAAAAPSSTAYASVIAAPTLATGVSGGGVKNPRLFATFHPAALIAPVESWLRNQSQVPTPWGETLKMLDAKHRELFLSLAESKNPLAEHALLQIMLAAQLDGVKQSPAAGAGFDKGAAQNIFKEHEGLVRKANTDLQKLIVESMGKGDNVRVMALNDLKSDLQKVLVSLQKMLAAKAMLPTGAPAAKGSAASPNPAPAAPAPVKSPTPTFTARPKKKESRLGEYLKIAALWLLICAFPTASGFYSWHLWNQPREQVKEINADEVDSYSPYFATVEKFQGGEQVNLTATLKPTWGTLDRERREQELKLLEQKFQLLKITSAKLLTADGKTFAAYSGGKFQAFPPRRLTKKHP